MSPSDNRQDFINTVRQHLGLEKSEVYDSEPQSAWMLRNQLWQGRPRANRFPLGLVFVNAQEATTARKNALERLAPIPNGFDAVAICEKDNNGRWAPSKVLERVGGAIGWRLKELCPDVEVRHVAPENTELPRPTVGATTKVVVDEIVRLLRDRPNIVLQGPPGTGKTYIGMRVAESLAETADLAALQFSIALRSTGDSLKDLLSQKWFLELPLVWELVQMHPGYTYDDFVRGRTLVADESGSHFESVDRIMPQIAAVAAARPGKPTLLIIDEINRCNLANVLGEMILALDPDKRGETVRLQYPPPSGTNGGDGMLLALPKDLLILATMNTADRSIALVDFAIRRRFRFVDLLPDEGVLREYYAENESAAEKAASLFREITAIVSDSRLRIGHSYFMSPLGEAWPSALANRIVYEVMPLLREYSAEGHILKDRKITLPNGVAIEIDENIDLRDTTVRDKIRQYLAG